MMMMMMMMMICNSNLSFRLVSRALNTEFIGHLRLDSRIAGYIIKVQ